MNNWREDTGMAYKALYKKKFAIFPIVCSDGTRLWLKYYYKKYKIWGNPVIYSESNGYYHIDFIENITEQEFIVRKLIENF